MKVSLQAQTTALTTGLVAALLATVGVLQHRQLGADRLATVRHQQEGVAEAIGDDLARHLDARLAAVAKTALRVESATDIASRRRALRDASAAGSGLDSVALLNRSADVIDGPLPRATLAALDRSRLLTALRGDRPSWLGPLRLHPGEPPAILLLAPVRAADGTIGAVVGAVAAAVPADTLARVAASTAAGIGDVEITSGGAAPSALLAPADRARVMAAAASDANAERILTRRPVGATGWNVSVAQTKHAALAGVADARSRLWTQLIVLGIGLSVLGAWAMRQLLRPLSALRDAMQALRGTFGAPARIDAASPDVRRQLAVEFEALHQQLHATRAELDALNRSSPRALQRQAATLRSVTEAIPAIVVVVDAEGRYRFVNSAFERWYGTPRDRIIGCTLPQVLGPLEYEKTRQYSDRALAGEAVDFERRYQRADGVQNLAISYIPLRLDNGEADGFVGVSQDITQHRREEGRLLQLAQRDGLTGLLNRIGFEEHLEACLDKGEGPELALLYIDLDHFKPVNDEFGHPVGDRVLQAFAARIRDAVRPTDASARLGGDEFAVVLKGVRDLESANRVAAKIVDAARTPFEIDGRTLHIGASVGVAYGLKPGTGWRDLVSHADTLLYEAKKAGRGRHASALH